MLPTEAEIQQAYSGAPRELKEYIDSAIVFDAFHEIRTAYKLHLDHAANLSKAIDSVILGIRSFTELPGLLTEALPGLDAEMQAKIVKDINDKVFVPLREQVKQKADEERTKKLEGEKKSKGDLRALEERLAEHAAIKIQRVAKPEEKPTVAPTPTMVPDRAPSVLEQKMPVTIPPPVPPTPTPAPAPASVSPPKYHGSDPYREPAE